jgi:nucleoside-diphosphate-sugar epimerase
MRAAASVPRGPVVVTGASGFIGQALVRHLHALRQPVVALARHAWAAPSGVRVIAVSAYDDAAALDAACHGAAVVVHLAALAHRRGSPEDFAASVRATETVAAASRRAGVRRLVLLSSIGVNGNRTDSRPFTEDAQPQPAEPYAVSKLQAEQALLATARGSTLETVIVRPPLVYGPDAPGNFGRLVRAVRRGWPLPFAAIANRRTFIALENLLELLTLCLAHPAAANQLLLAGDAEDLSTAQLVRCIAEGLGRPPRLFPVPASWLQAAAALAGRRRLAESLCESLQVDTSRARRLLGWRPGTSAQDGVRRAAAESRLP